MLFEQGVRLLENCRRYTTESIVKFILSSTGLDDQHFRRIVLAVQRMPRLQGPTGRPDVNRHDLGDHDQDDEEQSMSMSKRSHKDGKLYSMFFASKLLSSETRQWFLAAVLARDGPNHIGNASHRLMSLHTLLSVAKGRMSSGVLAHLKGVIHEALESTNVRYVAIAISLMCAVFRKRLF
jgi:hypothetical protein